jgi:predicted N-formylglutamate amidohydrolase
MPADFAWREKDAILENQHWAYDIGALDLATDLAKHFQSYLLYAKYSRLLLDVNRVVVSNSMFRENTQKEEFIDMNNALSDEDKIRRMQLYYIPFYQGLSRKL